MRSDNETLCNDAPYSNELNSASAGIRTRDLEISQGR